VLTLLNLSQPAALLTVVSAATYTAGPLAPGSIAAAFAEGILSAGVLAQGVPPLPTALMGVSITVKDAAGVSRLAPLYFVSSNQVNFLVPPAAATGLATIIINGALSAKSLTAQVQIAAIAPQLFTVGAGIAAAYAVQVSPAGAQSPIPVFNTQSGAIAPTPIDLTQPGAVYLTLFGTGFDTLGASTIAVTIEGISVPVFYSGPQSTYPGLDQVNVSLPQSLAGTGVASVIVSAGGKISNTIYVTIQ
jgi:uncharacterized protein (TIGR03437 family)